MNNYPFVSIIFPNYNGGREPLDCLDSIQKLSYPQNKIEVIVVDNASSDGSDKQIKKRYPLTRLIRLAKNCGFARAVNRGITLSRGKLIFIGNNDLLFAKNSLGKMVDFMLKNEEIGIVGGKIFYKYQPDKITSAGYMMNKWTGHIYSPPQPEKIKEPDWVQGCALLISKTVLQKLGSLDPQFTFFFEDYDLCIRAKQKGYKIVYLPTAIFWHSESLTINRNASLKYYYWYKNKFRFLIKNFPFFNILSIFLVQTFFILPYRALLTRDERVIPFLKGLSWNIINLPITIKARKQLHKYE